MFNSRVLKVKYEKFIRKYNLKTCPDCGFPMWMDSPHEICSGCVAKYRVADYLQERQKKRAIEKLRRSGV